MTAEARRGNVEVTHTPADPHHTQILELSWDEVVQALTALKGSRVAVRVVQRSEPETLVAVFHGHLGASTQGKQPTLFWPIRAVSEDQPGETSRMPASICTAIASTQAWPTPDVPPCISSKGP